MLFFPIEAILALTSASTQPRPVEKKTVEQTARESIREVQVSIAAFALQGAMLSPSAEGSARCFKQFLDIQLDILKGDLDVPRPH